MFCLRATKILFGFRLVQIENISPTKADPGCMVRNKRNKGFANSAPDGWSYFLCNKGKNISIVDLVISPSDHIQAPTK